MKIKLFALAGFLGVFAYAAAQGSMDQLEQGFRNPPDSAKPRVWWHWMNGNVTKEGITADLEWMKRVGIGGMQMFDGDMGVPQFTDKRLVWMTPEWKEAFRHVAAEADRLGLEMSMAASGGWSETAGPWVKPEQGMKKVVWSETELQGPQHFSGQLAGPPSNNGRFQNIPPPPELAIPQIKDLPGAKPIPPQAQPKAADPTYYADTAVIGYRLAQRETHMRDLHPKITSSGERLNSAALMDGDISNNVPLPVPAGGQRAWIQIEFDRPFRAQAFTIAAGISSTFGGASIPDGEVDFSEDGSHWEPLVSLPGPGHTFAGFPVRTYSFAPVTARLYRITFLPPHVDPLTALFGGHAPTEFKIAEIELQSGQRVDHWQEKAAFGNMMEFESAATPRVADQQAVSREDIVDLTGKMDRAGLLRWDVPAGAWVVLRLGYSLTGEKNHPATPEATGYEVDKLSHQDVESYVKTYVDMIAGALGPYFGKSFRYFLMDSWEANLENWTEEMIPEFRKRRGYDPTPYLPALTGRVIENADVSDRFLWDFRRTIADLLAENHYRLATEYFKQRGVGLYAEAMGAGLPTTGDGLLNKGQVDIPMGEFWTPLPGQEDTPEHVSDVREAASAAHIYDKPIVATESFTSMPYIPGWGQSPYYLKPLADKYFASGVNRIVFHTSDHQPFVDEAHKPGITLWMFGQHYTRNITWAEQAVAWNTYLARCSYLLQQGKYVADAAYFYGEGAPVTVPFWKQVSPAPPEGYSYDYVNADVLLNRMSVKDGHVMLPGGMSYRVLVLPEGVDRLTVPVLRKLRDLVVSGAIVIAPRPIQSPSLADYPNADREVRFLANELWGPIDGKSVTRHALGKGEVYWGTSVASVLAAAKTERDFEYNRPHSDTTLAWLHRRVGDREIYFVANQRDRAEDVEASFRVDGKQAELWHPDTAATEAAGYRTENGRTFVPLHLDANGSVFVIFRGSASSPVRVIPLPVRTELARVEDSWQVNFPANLGAPGQIHLNKLISWTAYPEDGVKYFSGTATYLKEIKVRKEWLQSGSRVLLDLGAVKEIAELSVNGKTAGGILWKPPYQADITDVLKPGNNHVEIRVTNLWPNRMIGDQQPGVTKNYTWTDYRPYNKDSKLLDSGLLGPVTISSLRAAH